jgi:hypothetical protein
VVTPCFVRVVERLCLSRNTVKAHVSSILRKLGLESGHSTHRNYDGRETFRHGPWTAANWRSRVNHTSLHNTPVLWSRSSRIPSLARSLGSGVREFRKGAIWSEVSSGY